jgi:hypothetical protein
MTQPAAPGWYPDPAGQPGTERWWSGTQWASNSRPTDQTVPPWPTQPGRRRNSGCLIPLAVIGGIVLALVAAGVVYGLAQSGTQQPGGAVTFRVTGTGTAGSVTLDLDGQESQRNSVPLPFYETRPYSRQYIIGLVAQSADGDATAAISCEIDVPGRAPVTNSSSGPFAVVSC